MAEIKWIKITTDIFDDDKIKLIEKMPEGDTILVVWLKLLVMAGKKNDCGMIYITRDIPYNHELLSDVMGRDLKIVSLALKTFVSFKMIEIVDDMINIVNWEKHQNIDGMEKIKEQNRLRQKEYRDRKSAQISQIPTGESRDVTLLSRDGNALDKTRLDKTRLDKNTREEHLKWVIWFYNKLNRKNATTWNYDTTDVKKAYNLWLHLNGDVKSFEHAIENYFDDELKEFPQWQKTTQKFKRSFSSFCSNIQIIFSQRAPKVEKTIEHLGIKIGRTE